MVAAGDVRKGVTIEYNGNVYVVVEFQHVKPGKGAAFVRTKLKNVVTGAVLEQTFNPSEKLENAHIETKKMTYSYNDGDLYYFMDEEFNLTPLNHEQVEDALKYIKENDPVTVRFYKGTAFSVECENFVELKIVEAEPGVTIIYGSMYGNTEQMAEAVASALADHGVRDIVMHNVSKSHASYILKDIFKYKGVIVGSPTYSNQLFPEVDALLSKIELREVKNRLFGYFGSFSWAGAAVKRLAAFGEKMKWETVGTPVEQKQGLSADKYAECRALGEAMAKRLTIND